MNPVVSVVSCFKKYVSFKGRASRSEFWWFMLFNFIVEAILLGIAYLSIPSYLMRGSSFERVLENLFKDSEMLGAAPMIFFVIALIYALGVLLPSIAVSVRRLHDTDKNVWWFVSLLILLPIILIVLMNLIDFIIPFVIPICWIVLIVLYCLKGNEGENTFGANPSDR